jgi:hypothetical protein
MKKWEQETVGRCSVIGMFDVVNPALKKAYLAPKCITHAS